MSFFAWRIERRSTYYNLQSALSRIPIASGEIKFWEVDSEKECGFRSGFNSMELERSLDAMMKFVIDTWRQLG
jgi:hypothetical protein